MSYIEWKEIEIAFNVEKSRLLKRRRGVSFEEVVHFLEEGALVAMVDHPHSERYPTQKLLYIEINEYVYAVPCILEPERVFLKTIYPDRKATKRYLKTE